ncbi:MAG: fibrillarin-like rRNA/tRNA 2'-O-methyltransferase, partial [archaeon]|nr:fibrillarin-like rRNA/tRNA 2'-O-methyltransferase [archaeon]
MKQIFNGIFSDDKRLLTKNLVPGKKVYGERLFSENDEEFREWVPWRSKLAAGIKNKLEDVPLKQRSTVLYLGSSEGTTASHVSDIIGANGLLFGVDSSERVMRKFIGLCEDRENLVPILADANKPKEYEEYLKGHSVDLLFQDISQKNQAEIFNKNAALFLSKGKPGLIAIKAKSISQGDPKQVFKKEIATL